MASGAIPSQNVPGSQETLLCNRCSATFSIPHRSDPTSILHQFRDNYGADYVKPSIYEKRGLLDLYSLAKEDVARCDEEIARLKAITAELEQQREMLVMQRDRYRDTWRYIDEEQHLRAHVRRLPTEILLEIFLYCVQSRHGYPRRDKAPTPAKLAPFNLELACLRWRDIASSSKELWSFIWLDFTDETHIPATEVLKTFLRRSGDYPLTLNIQDLHGKQDVLELYKHLAPHSNRWLDVNFSLFGDMRLLGRAWRGIRGALPILEKLTILTDSSDPMQNLFENAPNVRCLTIKAGLAWPSPNFRISTLPWDQLIELQLSCSSRLPLLPILAGCLRLSRLDIQSVNKLDPSSLRETARISSNLQFLSISERWRMGFQDEVNHLSLLLDCLVLPRLVSLSITTRDQSKWPHIQMSALLRRSHCSLKTLWLNHVWIQPSDFLELLSLLPTLTSLRVHESQVIRSQYANHDVSHRNSPPIITHGALSSLTYSSMPESVVLLPRLTELDLQFTPPSSDQLPIRSLIGMIESRWFAKDTDSSGSHVEVACLKHVTLLFFSESPDAATLSQFVKLRQAGLRIDLR